jgi:hypothetical protein
MADSALGFVLFIFEIHILNTTHEEKRHSPHNFAPDDMKRFNITLAYIIHTRHIYIGFILSKPYEFSGGWRTTFQT